MKPRRIDWYPVDWLDGVAAMPPDQRGVYDTIINLIYAHGDETGIEMDERELAARCYCHWRELRRILAALVSRGKVAQDGRRICITRCGEELQRAHQRLRGIRLIAAQKRGCHTKDEWSALLEICGYRCIKCFQADNIQKDHITPIYRGGSDAIDNLQPLCRICNAAKGPHRSDHRPSTWRAQLLHKLAKSSKNNELQATPLTSLHQPSTIKKEEEDSVADATAESASADPPPSDQIGDRARDLLTAGGLEQCASADPPPDPIKVLWDRARELLTAAGVAKVRVGPLIGRWRRDFGDSAVMAAFDAAERELPSDLVPFLIGCMSNGRVNGNGHRQSPADKLFEGARRAVEAREARRRADLAFDDPLLDS